MSTEADDPVLPAALQVVARQDERIEDLRHDLATVYRWSRWGLGLLASFLTGGIAADLAVGSPPVVPLVRLGGIALALVAYRQVRAAERERGL